MNSGQDSFPSADSMMDSRFVHLAVIALVVISIFSFHLVFKFENLYTSDVHNMAQAARNIALGNGYTTKVIYPLSWSMFPTIESHPEFQFPPLYPHLVAAGFILLGVKSYVPVLVSGIAYLWAAFVAYFIVERIFDRRSAFYATLMFSTYYHIVLVGVMGRTEATYLLFVLASILVVLWDERRPWLLGVLSGFAYLTRFNHWFFLAGILVFALYKVDRNRRKYFLQFFIPFLLVLSPYMLRNFSLVGSPFYHHQVYELVSDTVFYPAFAIKTAQSPPDPWWFALNHPGSILMKWLSNLSVVYRSVPRLLGEGWIILVLACLGYLGMGDDERTQEQRGLLFIFLAGFLLQGLLLSFVRARVRYYIPFLPVVFFLAGKEISVLIHRRTRKWLGIGLLVIILGTNLFYSLGIHASSQRNIDRLARVKKKVPAGQAILTNIPQVLAWATNRPSLAMLPFEEAEEFYGPYNFVLLSRRPEALHSLSETREFLRNSSFREKFSALETYPRADARLYRRVKRSK